MLWEVFGYTSWSLITETGTPRFYRRLYPFAALIILAFEAWALVTQLQGSGLKTEEYFFAVVWIIALLSVISL